MHPKSLQLYHNSLQPYGLQPTWLLCPQDSPGKNTGMGCHGDLSNPGVKPTSLKSPALASRFFITGTTWEAHKILYILYLSFHFVLSQDQVPIFLLIIPLFLLLVSLEMGNARPLCQAELWPPRRYHALIPRTMNRIRYGSGQLFSSPGDLPIPGLLHCRQILYHLSHQGCPLLWGEMEFPLSPLVPFGWRLKQHKTD